MKTFKTWKKGLLIAIGCTGTLLLAGFLFLARFQSLRQQPLRAFTTPTPSATPTPSHSGRQVVQAPLLAGNTGGQASTGSVTVTPAPTLEPMRVLGANTINLVLMGLDSDTAREAKGRGYRSDTIAVLVIDVNKPACTVINVPRDTRARVRKLNSSGKVIGTQYNKINASFQFGGGPEKFGHQNLIYSLEQLFFDGLKSDVNMGFYASIDMDGIAMFADAVEGVPVTLEYDIKGFGKKGERIVLQGEQARKFVRLRHGITGGSDIGRIGRQQAFIRAFAKRVQEMGAIEAVPRLWSSLAENVNTNLNTEQILVLADLLSRLKLDDVEFVMLPGSCKTIEGTSYYMPNTKKIKALSMQLWGD